jgi:hypothetical protein
MKARQPTPDLIKQYQAFYMKTALRFIAHGDVKFAIKSIHMKPWYCLVDRR